jgi:hypothetical protein
MPDFSSTNQPTTEAKKRGWTFKQTMERLLSQDDAPLGTNDRVPMHERVVRAHIKRAAVDGDMPAIKELYDRVDGKLTDKVEATGKDGAPLVPDIDPTELARRIALILTKPGGTP